MPKAKTAEVITPTDVVKTAMGDFVTVAAYRMAEYIGTYGSQKYVQWIASILDVVDFEIRSGHLTTQELYAAQALLTMLGDLAVNDTRYAEVAAQHAAHTLQHFRSLLKLLAEGKSEPNLLACIKETTESYLEDIDQKSFEDFKLDRAAWYKKEAYYRKHPNRRPSNLPNVMEVLAGLFNGKHGRGRPDGEGVIEL